MTDILTFDRIERMGKARLKLVLEELAGSYLEQYSIINPWCAWLIARDAKLAEKQSPCGWQTDWTVDWEESYG